MICPHCGKDTEKPIKKYGCYINIDCRMKYARVLKTCVIGTKKHEDCTEADYYIKKEDCPHWRKIK